MPLSGKSAQPVRWFWIALTGILSISLVLRFWGLERFNTLVFDEVYYANFANNYLTEKRFFDGHPPLSKYLIAFGIWVGSALPFGRDAINNLTGSALTTWSYRWLNALTGALIPLVIAAIAYQLNYRRSFAVIAGLFAAIDGLFLVESRYALNNVYLVIFGLLGQLFLLFALNARTKLQSADQSIVKARRNTPLFLSISGIFFAASFSIKWNGLWFLFGGVLLWIVAWLLRFLGDLEYSQTSPQTEEEWQKNSLLLTPVLNLTKLKIPYLMVCFGVIPALFYWLIWIPHIQLNPEFGFWEVQRQILGYHQRVGSGTNIHPYCSTWYSWILMLRPVAYFYQVAASPTAPLPTSGSMLTLLPGRVVYDVHAMGNPLLWWCSSGAIVLLFGVLIVNFRALPSLVNDRAPKPAVLPTQELWTVLFIAVNYIGNLLPWMPVSRCVFLYHYMGSSVFASLALAWFVDRWLRSTQWRYLALWMIGITIAAFIFWMPIYLGLPLTEQAYQMRMWLKTWI